MNASPSSAFFGTKRKSISFHRKLLRNLRVVLKAPLAFSNSGRPWLVPLPPRCVQTEQQAPEQVVLLHVQGDPAGV